MVESSKIERKETKMYTLKFAQTDRQFKSYPNLGDLENATITTRYNLDVEIKFEKAKKELAFSFDNSDDRESAKNILTNACSDKAAMQAALNSLKKNSV